MISPDITTRLSTTGQLLVRSGIEIDRILTSIAKDGDTVSASLPQKMLFLSRVVSVDPVRQHMLLSYSEHKNANSAVLSSRSVILRCNHRGAQFAFSGTSPRQTLHARQPAIQLALPTQMLAVQHRRAVQRVAVPAQTEVDCQLRLGVIAFDAKLVDVSLGGTGFLLCDDAIPVCTGTRIEGARIRHPRGEPLIADFEVRQVMHLTLANGQRATRIGCRILAAPQDMEELIRLFIIDLQ